MDAVSVFAAQTIFPRSNHGNCSCAQGNPEINKNSTRLRVPRFRVLARARNLSK
jgi:hypothetical protein